MTWRGLISRTDEQGCTLAIAAVEYSGGIRTGQVPGASTV